MRPVWRQTILKQRLGVVPSGSDDIFYTITVKEPVGSKVLMKFRIVKAEIYKNTVRLPQHTGLENGFGRSSGFFISHAMPALAGKEEYNYK